jgi:hypothetical protein
LAGAERPEASWTQMTFGGKNKRGLDDFEKKLKIIVLHQLKPSLISIMIYFAYYILAQQYFRN